MDTKQPSIALKWRVVGDYGFIERIVEDRTYDGLIELHPHVDRELLNELLADANRGAQLRRLAGK